MAPVFVWMTRARFLTWYMWAHTTSPEYAVSTWEFLNFHATWDDRRYTTRNVNFECEARQLYVYELRIKVKEDKVAYIQQFQ